MFDNDSFIIGQFTEGEPTVSWLGYSDPGVGRRIEAYIAWRWGERPVEWVIKGEGLFIPPLKPVTITADGVCIRRGKATVQFFWNPTR